MKKHILRTGILATTLLSFSAAPLFAGGASPNASDATATAALCANLGGTVANSVSGTNSGAGGGGQQGDGNGIKKNPDLQLVPSIQSGPLR